MGTVVCLDEVRRRRARSLPRMVARLAYLKLLEAFDALRGRP
jgi:hypothetical protein